jgi:hypothetical protein
MRGVGGKIGLLPPPEKYRAGEWRKRQAQTLARKKFGMFATGVARTTVPKHTNSLRERRPVCRENAPQTKLQSTSARFCLVD